MTSSHSPEQLRAPDIIQGSMGAATFIKPATFSFSPIGPVSASSSYTAPVRPVAASASTFRILPSAPPSSQTRPGLLAKRKTTLDGPEPSMDMESEPMRKVHLSEELVAQTMADLYISHPRPKVARRSVSNDVTDAMTLTNLEGLEDRFNHQAAINIQEDLPLPPQRSRKLPSRHRGPQLRLSMHQELKNMRTTNSILPDSIMARYRPGPRTASTAVVLWKPPPPSGSFLPDLVSSALRNGPVCGRHRTRCYSEVTSTPYSSHENLCSDSDMPDLSEVLYPEAPLGPPLPCGATQCGSATAEAPELSYGEAAEVPPGVNLQRRNSAPEMSEPAHFVDDGSMEL